MIHRMTMIMFCLLGFLTGFCITTFLAENKGSDTHMYTDPDSLCPRIDRAELIDTLCARFPQDSIYH
jgi:hypothetical protein